MLRNQGWVVNHKRVERIWCQEGLNMAEINLSVLSRQCLNRRITDEQTLSREVQAWVNARNKKVVKVDWRFSTANARIKLKRLYPKNHD